MLYFLTLEVEKTRAKKVAHIISLIQNLIRPTMYQT